MDYLEKTEEKTRDAVFLLELEGQARKLAEMEKILGPLPELRRELAIAKEGPEKILEYYAKKFPFLGKSV